MHKTIPAGRPIVSGSGGPRERGHVETQTMQTAECRLQTVQTVQNVQTVQTECYFFTCTLIF